MSEFIFAEEKAECIIIVDSLLDADLSSGKWLVKKVRDISGATLEIAKKGGKVNQKKVLIGTLSESPNIRKILEKGKIIIGQDNPAQVTIAVDKGSDSLSKNKTEVLRSSMLRRFYLCPEDLGEQGFIVYKMDEETLILCGGTPRGTSYAVQTLINHLYLENGVLKVEDLHTEKLPIFSQPAIPCRAVFTNIGGPDHIGHDQWVKEWQRDGEYDHKGFIDWLAQFKITHLNIMLFPLGFGIAYPSAKFPECVNKYHPNVKKEFIGEMIDYAHKRFINVFMIIDFPDLFAGILRHHPELGMKQIDFSQFPDGDWEVHQKMGFNISSRKGHDFRIKFGTVCASNPKVMSFWEEYLEEVFNRYPGLDGIMGEFAEEVSEICSCDNCQKNFLKLQWQYFKRMAEIAQKDKPERVIYNCASPGDVEILRHRSEIKNFIHLDWGSHFPLYVYGCACPHGEWYLLHHSGKKWHEFDWKQISQFLCSSHFEGIMKRSVSYKPRDNDHFAFGEFAWNPELSIEDYAHLYVRMSLRKKDAKTSALYFHWIKAHGYNHILKQLHNWKVNGKPFSAKKIDQNYPRLLKKELAIISSLLKKIKAKNRIVEEIKDSFEKHKDEWVKLEQE